MQKYRLSDEPRPFTYQHNGDKCSLMLRQIIAVADFADVTAGTQGGWIDDESALSHEGNCWIYDQNSMVFNGAVIRGDSRLTGPCEVSFGAVIEGMAWIDESRIGQGAHISDNVTIKQSIVQGECRISGDAQVLEHSHIIGMHGLTDEDTRRLHIYGRARVIDSRVVHQAQIYDDAVVQMAFIEHRAEVFGFARLEGNALNNVWVCDCAKVYDYARLLAGDEEDAIPTLRYSAQVAEHATVEGNCVLRHHVRVGGHAYLRGGPLLLDDNVLIEGRVQIYGDVLIEHHIALRDDAVIDARNSEGIHLRGPKVVDNQQCITRTPLVGLL